MNTAVSHALGTPTSVGSGTTSTSVGGGFLSGENTKFFIHVAAEAVVIAGVTYYLSGRCTTLENIVFEQSQKIKKLEETLAAHEGALNQIIAAMNGGRGEANDSRDTRTEQREARKKHKKPKVVEVPTSINENDGDEATDINDQLDQELEGEV